MLSPASVLGDFEFGVQVAADTVLKVDALLGAALIGTFTFTEGSNDPDFKKSAVNNILLLGENGRRLDKIVLTVRSGAVTAIIESKLFEISEIPLPAAWPPFAAGLASSRICGAGPPSPSFEAGSPRQLRPVSGASNQRFSRAPKHCSSGGGSCSQKLSQPSSAEPDHRLQFAPVVTWEQDWDPPLDAKSLVGAETNRR